MVKYRSVLDARSFLSNPMLDLRTRHDPHCLGSVRELLAEILQGIFVRFFNIQSRNEIGVLRMIKHFGKAREPVELLN